MPAGVTSSQTTSTAQLLAIPQPGAPISFDQIEEHSVRVLDGTSRVEFTVTGKTYRDSAGRIRKESEIRNAQDEHVGSSISVLDPVAGLQFVMSRGTVYRRPFLSSGEGQYFSADAADGQESPHQWTTKTENAGKRKIEDREFEGIRTITIAEDEPRLATTVEEWHSPQLKLIGRVDRFGPYKAYTIKIQNLRQEEPDPALFALPADYEIIDLPQR